MWPAVTAAEELGYDSIWVSDTATQDGLAPLVTLAAIAARTERLKLGTSVLVLPPRNPLLLARELASVDLLSGGRLLPAGGLGINVPSELGALGVAAEERVARMEEALKVVRLLWSGDPVSYSGRFTVLDGVQLRPRPTRPRLEFWLGGRAEVALRRIGRIADGWLGSFVSPEEFAVATATIRRAAAEAGRAIDEDHYGTTIFASSDSGVEPDPRIRALRPGLAQEDHLARGPQELVELLERFIAEGASKFVVVPVAEDVPAWLREMRPAIAAVETA
jgi:probable F420-dependent oxidoreductase